MTRFGWLVFTTLFLILAGAVALFFIPKPVPTPVPVSTEPAVEEDLEGQSIYVSGEHGFTLRYPSSSRIEEPFSGFWRVNAPASATGTPLLGIIGYETKSEKAYPRSYSALVRVAFSTHKDEVKNCEKPTAEEGEEALPDRTIQGTIWKAFSFEDAAMQKYVKGVSYRTLHEGKCFALEMIAKGSSYREEESAQDIPQETLDAAYASLDDIVESFAFTNP